MAWPMKPRDGAPLALMMVIVNVAQCNNVTKEGLAGDEIISLG